ncbi:phosphoglycerate kinase [Candidatus Kaiserbacteria bacterium RIFCSPHIGHO2_01_FULL_49_13]|uniref:Phosphoglycerate kinase n=1 Tax=Candidatus Kaiserbacteria bacterium RIFCSPHIGHO2_01_FULL_49_13 TaxID=1798477 RepID=A0A1F6CFT9_9BACT|nr:MAG: phosphoglycerate kinase [Candidatus Kaiserbacteria bacterium RIFCSPHIGHO2_01_FULL_49_13]
MPKALPDIRAAENLQGKRVLLRADLNVPVEGTRVLGTFRLRQSLETIEFLRRAGARIILVSHLGRSGDTLLPVAEALSRFLPISFVPDILGARAKVAHAALKNGEVLLLENLRRDPREEANDILFARSLAAYADIFVQDAFAVAHREHASIIQVPKLLPKYAGLLFQKEVRELTTTLRPKSPSLCLIGGAKVETKEPLIQKFLGIYDRVFVGGALANDLYRALGYEIGKSLVSPKALDLSRIIHHPRLLLPQDVTVQTNGRISIKKPQEILKEDTVYDIGPQTTAEIARCIKRSSFVLWNGPMGNYERGFVAQTEEIAKVLATSGAYSVVGGGDTIAAIAKLKLEERFSFVSTGGGAMLDFLYLGTLPGIEALL